VSEPQPDRGGAWDFRGAVRVEYSPRRNRTPDPGEVVWAWVPFEEDHRVGKDRPLLVIGRDEVDSRVFVGLMLSSKDHQGRRDWWPVGTGPWDPERRPSWVRLDRPLAVQAGSVRREGAALPSATFQTVVEHAVAGARGSLSIVGGVAVPARRSLVRRLLDRFRR
jgi:hypothetical protein